MCDFSQNLHFFRPQRLFWRAALPTIICWEHSKYVLRLIIQFITTKLHRIILRTDPQRTWPVSSCQMDFVPSIPLRPEWHAQMKKGAIMALPRLWLVRAYSCIGIGCPRAGAAGQSNTPAVRGNESSENDETHTNHSYNAPLFILQN